MADVKDGIENTVSGSAIVMNVDPVVAARAGFTPQEIELDASAILQGEPAPTPVVLDDRAYTIRVRFPESTRSSVDAIKSTLLVSSTGHTGTLGTLATVEDIPGQTEVRRENLQRNVTVTARLESAQRMGPLLVDQLTAPVRFTQAASELMREGVRTFVEVGPGNVLSGLVKRIDRGVHTVSINNLEQLDRLPELLAET